VQAEDMAQRGQVAAMNGEDSGSVYLSRAVVPHDETNLAGTPANAQ
jgi:hypothetical protein